MEWAAFYHLGNLYIEFSEDTVHTNFFFFSPLGHIMSFLIVSKDVTDYLVAGCFNKCIYNNDDIIHS